MVDAEKLRALLYRATKRPWKQTYAYNNAGMPTADFYIPGHNGNATVEMLADDAALIVDGVDMLPDLLKVFEAALEFVNQHVSNPEQLDDLERQIQMGKVFGAKEKLFDAVNLALLPYDEDDDDVDIDDDAKE
jgi:hypothetical protein